jgi:hypothetical protein
MSRSTRSHRPERSDDPARPCKPAATRPDGVALVTMLQRSAGNAAVSRLLVARQEPAPAAPAPAPTPAAITMSGGANAVPEGALDIVRDVLTAAGVSSATVSRTHVTAHQQAVTMYNNCVSQGVEAQKELYGASGDQVIDVYASELAAGKTPDEIKAAMEAKLNEVGPTNVSNHIRPTSEIIVIDVGKNSVAQSLHQALIDAAEADARVDNFIHQNDPAFHFEILPSALTPPAPPATPTVGPAAGPVEPPG